MSEVALGSMTIERLGETCFLEEFFLKLNELGEKYCVLRDYEGLPSSACGSDIDIAILPDSADSITTLAKETAAKYGGGLIVNYKGSGQFIRMMGRYQGHWWGVAIDLFEHIEYKGIEYISCENIIETAKEYGTIKVANDDDSIVIALVKELISNGRSRKNYLPEAARIWQEQGASCLHLLEMTFSKSTLDEFAAVLSNEESSIDSLVKSLRSDVLRGGSYWQRLSNIWSRLRRLWSPPGICVAVLGTDGSGKSTLIEGIKPVLEQALHSPIHYEHLRPNWIPRLGEIAGKNNTGEVVSNPHGQKPSGKLGSIARLMYYTVDYYVGYWLKIHVKIAKEPRIVLFDRYYHDFILDPYRMRVVLPPWIIRLMMVGAPKPNLILCLGAEPEVIFDRKPETSLVEVTRQVDLLKKICKSSSQAVWIDTGTSIEVSCDQALEAIKNTML